MLECQAVKVTSRAWPGRHQADNTRLRMMRLLETVLYSHSLDQISGSEGDEVKSLLLNRI